MQERTTNMASSAKIPSIVGPKIRGQKLPLGNLQASRGYKAHKQNIKTNMKQYIDENCHQEGVGWGLRVYNKGDAPKTLHLLHFS